MSSNSSIIIYKGERHEDYVCHIFRYPFTETKSTLNSFIEKKNDDWVTGTEFPAESVINRINRKTTQPGKFGQS